MSIHNMFSLRDKKNTPLIIWILFLARAIKSEVLVPGQVNFVFVLREMGQDGPVGHGISTALR